MTRWRGHRWQAERGCSYEVVITTLAGFTRYRLHDIVRIVDFYGQTPVFEFIERRGHHGHRRRKTAEHHCRAIAEACRIVKAAGGFFVTPIPNRLRSYLLAVEKWHGVPAMPHGEFLRAVWRRPCAGRT
jgi:hypothetical protein